MVRSEAARSTARGSVVCGTPEIYPEPPAAGWVMRPMIETAPRVIIHPQPRSGA